MVCESIRTRNQPILLFTAWKIRAQIFIRHRWWSSTVVFFSISLTRVNQLFYCICIYTEINITSHQIKSHCVYVNLRNHWFDNTNRLLFFTRKFYHIENFCRKWFDDFLLWHDKTWHDMTCSIFALARAIASATQEQNGKENKYNDKLYCIMIMTAETW